MLLRHDPTARPDTLPTAPRGPPGAARPRATVRPGLASKRRLLTAALGAHLGRGARARRGWQGDSPQSPFRCRTSLHDTPVATSPHPGDPTQALQSHQQPPAIQNSLRCLALVQSHREALPPAPILASAAIPTHNLLQNNLPAMPCTRTIPPRSPSARANLCKRCDPTPQPPGKQPPW